MLAVSCDWILSSESFLCCRKLVGSVGPSYLPIHISRNQSQREWLKTEKRWFHERFSSRNDLKPVFRIRIRVDPYSIRQIRLRYIRIRIQKVKLSHKKFTVCANFSGFDLFKINYTIKIFTVLYLPTYRTGTILVNQLIFPPNFLPGSGAGSVLQKNLDPDS